MEENDEISVKRKGGGSIIDQAPVFSPDGQYVFVVWKNSVRSYSVETGERITDFEGCEHDIAGVGILPTNSQLLVACSAAGEIAVWKWQAQLLMSKNKLDCDVDEVHSFHLLSLASDAETSDCEMLLSWSSSDEYNIATFSFKHLTLQRNVPMVFKKKPLAIAVGGLPGNQFMVAIDQAKLLCYAFEGSTKVARHRAAKGTRFTCVTCHPEQNCVATGDSAGRAIVWQQLFSRREPIQTVYHWHTLPVNVVAFSQSGTSLYSGGDECVLVKWRLDNLRKDFLPRLPAPIKQLKCALGNVTLAVATANNAIHLINPHFRVKQVIQQLTWAATVSAGLKVDSRTKTLVLNGHVGNVQFYSPRTMSLLHNLDVVGQNKLTRERDTDVPNTNVTKIALSAPGDWLACVEERRDNDSFPEIRLKFFRFDDVNQTYILNTSVEFPHENGVSSLEFQPIATTDDLLCATTGNDFHFKVWSLVDTTDIYRKNRAWRCTSSGYYKNLPASALSFSMDGSLLAVSFGACLTAWSPDTCEMKCSLVHPNFRTPLRTVQFGNADNCHLVVTTTSYRICVWNLLTLALIWTVPVRITHLCSDPLSKYMAAFTSNNSLFIFAPGTSTPVFYRKNIVLNNVRITAATFVPQASERSTGPLWQRMSTLYFINSNQELLCLEPEDEQSANEALEYSSRPRKSAFDALLAETVSTTQKTSSDQVTHMDKGLSGATEIKQLIEPPIHTMAPMRLLCNSVLRSLILREGAIQVPEDIEEDFPEDETPESDLDSDSETNKRRTVKKPPLKSTKRSTKKRKENLKHNLNESLSWTSVLLD